MQLITLSSDLICSANVPEESAETLFVPKERNIISWGSSDRAFGANQGSPDTAHQSDRPTPMTRTLTIIEQPPLLLWYKLAYNRVNKFIFCENPGKVGGVRCAALPVNHTYKHLMQTAIRESSDCIVHGYKIKPSDKKALEENIAALYPDAPFTPAQLKNIVPLPGQVGPIIGVGPPVPGYMCKQCHHGYTTRDSAGTHIRHAHNDPERPGRNVFNFFFEWIPQMQSLSLHGNFTRYFAITPGAVESQGPALPLASSDDMAMLSALQEQVFGPDDGMVEPDSDAVLEFFRNSGAVKHVEGLPCAELLRLVGTPREDEPKLVKLRRAQGLRFELHCMQAYKGSIALRRLIVTNKP